VPRIYYIEQNGVVHDIVADAGESAMQIAVDHLLPGITGDCGGCCSCATCHVYVDDAWRERLPPASDEETMMLEGAVDVRPESRLGCQIRLTEELDGLVLRLPES
jgi:2Fe-2S ferredoxin